MKKEQEILDTAFEAQEVNAEALDTEAEQEIEHEELKEEFAEMSPGKRRAVKIISVVLFLGLVTAVVLFTDHIIEVIKNIISNYIG